MAGISDQNWVVWNQGKNPLVNFNFMLRVELLFDLPCKSVRAFSRELEYDYIQEGGLNDYVHMRRKPISRPFTLEIERYVGVDYMDPLPLGADLTLPVLLFVSRNHDQFIPGVVARTYVFTGCTVMKKTYGDLVADQSGLLVETTTLGYREMLCVDIPWSEVGDDISKDVKTVPTNARTLDKTPAELKAIGQDLYNQALAARDRAKDEFAVADADALIEELTETLAELRAATGAGGALTQRLDAAKRGLNGAGGKTKKALADEAEQEVPAARAAADEKREDWAEKDAQRRRAKDALDALGEEIEEKRRESRGLDMQLAKNGAESAELENSLPAELREESAAQTALDQAQKAYDAAEKELRQTQAEYDTAPESVDEGEENEEGAEKPRTKAELARDLETMAELRNEAKRALDNAARQRKNCAELAKLRSEREQLEAEKKRLEAELSDLGTTALSEAEQEEAAARAAADAASSAYEKAEDEWKDTAARAEAARNAAGAADRELADAQAALERGMGQINPLQNSLTNMKLRRTKGETAQKDCAGQHDRCRDKNDELQAASEGDLLSVNRLFEEVKKLSRQTCLHERQVRETCQHMQAARKLLSEVVELPAGA